MSFKIKTVLGIALIEVVLLAILVVSGLYYIRSSNEESLLQAASTSASLLSTMTTDATVSFDLATLDELVAQAASNADIMYARIRGIDGQTMSAAGNAEALAAPFVEDRTIADARVDSRLDIAKPIRIGGQDFGQVEIGVSTAGLVTTFTKARNWMISVAASEIILVAVFGLLLGQFLTVQLRKLRAATRRVAGGDFGYQIEIRGRDELAQTAERFNAMSRALKSYREKAEQNLALAEELREKAETRLYQAIEAMPNGVMILDNAGRVILLNERYRELYNLPEDFPPYGQTLDSVVRLQAPRISAEPFFSEGTAEPTPLNLRLEERIRRLSRPESYGTWETQLTDDVIVLCTQRRIGEGGLVVVETDISDLYENARRMREMEKDRLQGQKLESLGTLAGGVAHEINTPAQFIGDNLRFLAESHEDLVDCINRLAEALRTSGKLAVVEEAFEHADFAFIDEEAPKAIQQALEGIGRIAEIVRAVKVYAHPGTSELAPTNINQLIRNAIVVTTSNWKFTACVTEDLAPGLPLINGNEGQLGQVIVNLLNNATDALREMPRAETGARGSINIRTARDASDSIMIEICDDGPGIPREILDRIFDPFFTTKQVGKGSGQGLAISHAIICDMHGGKIDVEAPDSGGTRFTIRLPVHEEAVPESA